MSASTLDLKFLLDTAIFEVFEYLSWIETPLQSTVIDYIATSHINNIVSSGVLEIGLSDHYLVHCIRKI